MARKRLAYQRTFNGAGNRAPHLDGSIVLADLQRIARVKDGHLVVSPVTRTSDPYASAHRAGMHDMLARITLMLGLTEYDTFDTSEEANDSAPT